MVQILMQFISTPSYSIALNGEVFGFFKGQRGLRQGGPLSPLIFTICLEYFSRILQIVQKHAKFRFHPLCKRIGISHLCFADDLILFCKGDRASIELMVNAFNFFSKASGLQLNRGKCNFYYNGVDEGLVKEVERATGMCRGNVPFGYLGVSVSPKRLSILDCNCLVDKVVDRIRGLGSKQLSYAGRTCHGGLKVCRAEKQGGLGIKNLQIWNCAAIAKYVWWIKKKENHLWVKWVHAIYIKGDICKDYEPPLNSSLAWRKICQIKTLMKDCIWAQNVHYSINYGYSWLLPDTGTVDLAFMASEQRLLTQVRLMNMGIAQHNSCYLCGIMPEDHKHLFIACVYSATCCRLVSDWCSFQIPLANCIQWWIALRSRTLTQKKALTSLSPH
ncbi:uncharacterized protein LOC141589846 [Silene latifolia]|uniref:uncharacterized protein LOC141589846 n=1 Tax=Silene latifolia TaxID=37657 RepID=UPI003D7775A9